MKSLPTLKSTACTRSCATNLEGERFCVRTILYHLARRLLKVQPGEFYLQPAPRRDDRSDSEEEETLFDIAKHRLAGYCTLLFFCDISVPILDRRFMSKNMSGMSTILSCKAGAMWTCIELQPAAGPSDLKNVIRILEMMS